MNKENIKKWVKALRSGKYQQCYKRLTSGPGCYCVLGLACEISELGFWDYGANSYIINNEYEGTLLPEPVVDWLGLETIPKVNGSKLYQLNDTGKDFCKLANLIEEEFLNV